MGVKRETLEGGNVLRALVAQFNNDRTEQNLFALLRCLRDSFIWIPCNAVISNEDAEQFLNAQKGDVILLAGKGHETYQILNEGTIHFDEREVLAKFIK